MRKNHHGKNDRLVKRVFALCLALAVICTCLVPVFATEDLSDLQVEKGASQPVDGEGGKEEAGGFGGEEAPRPVADEGGEEEAAGSDGDSPAVDDSEAAGSDGDSPAVDDSEAAGSDGEEASQPVDGEGGEDNPGEGGEDNPGEDAVVDMNEEVVSGDEIKKLQDMVVYRFWLKELKALDLQEIAMQAQTDKMTESEYLARNGEVWSLYFIQAVPRAETIADYSSYIKDPSSDQDPTGMLRLFDHWYTLDELGDQVRLDLSDPTSNILDDETTTVNVYAAWKDGTVSSDTVSSDEEEDVVHEDLVDKNPAPVTLETTAAATYKGEGDNTESVDLSVEVKNLPSAAHSLSVIRMSHDDMGSFYESLSNDFRSMAPLLGLKISPKNTNGETVQPAKGDVATVTVSGLNELSAMKGATANTLEVFHETSDGNVEILDVLTYTNGTLTFETSSFSPFVVVRTDGYDTETLETKNGYEPLYLYLLKPQYVWDGSQVNSTDYWYGIGIAQVKTSGYKDSSSATDITNRINNQNLGGAIYLEPYSGTATITSPYGWDDYTASYDGRQLYPPIDPTTGEIVKDEKGNVVWDTTTGYRYWDGKGSEPTYKYYTIEWIHTGKTSGALANGYNYPEINGSYWSYHLDGRVHLSTTYNVDFKVKEPGSTTFEYLPDYSVLVNKGASESIITQPQNNTKKPYNIKQYESQGYAFDGWYEDEDCTQKAEFNGKINEDKVYYGRFIKESSNLKISKTVTGKLGDTNKAFTFQILDADDNPVALTNDNCNGVLLADGTDGKFTLKHGDTVTIKNLVPGTYKVKEIGDDLTGYETSWKVGTDDTVHEKSTEAPVTMSGTNMTLAFTNHCALEPDTGVLLDTLPYIVILAVVAGGVALLMLRKRRKEDD